MQTQLPLGLRRGIGFVRWVLCITLVLFGVNYCVAANDRARASANTGDWETSISDTHGGAYTAKYIVMHRDKILLRLYRTGDPALLAERTYQEHGVAFVWTEHALIYDTSEDDGGIRLPPTRMDRLLAKLP